MKPVPAIATTQLYGPASLVGSIGRSKGAKDRATGDAALNNSTSPARASATNLAGLRPEFMTELARRTKQDLTQLDDVSTRDLKKLQGAAEGFESHFVKDLLSQMRKTAFSEKDSPTGDLAKDLLDQQLAEQTAKSGAGLGIAKTLFSQMGQQVVAQAKGREKI